MDYWVVESLLRGATVYLRGNLNGDTARPCAPEPHWDQDIVHAVRCADENSAHKVAQMMLIRHYRAVQHQDMERAA